MPSYALIGKGTYGSPAIREWGEGSKLRTGSYCSIAGGVQIFLGGEHRTDWVTTYPFNVLWESASHLRGHPATKGDVEIGNDVWIGADALIMSGVRIGSGACIGARSVVVRDVSPYEVVAGNPARHIRFRFDPDTVQALLDIAWWNWEWPAPILCTSQSESPLLMVDGICWLPGREGRSPDRKVSQAGRELGGR
ncbi:MAG TPA: CatB-related O-acetyltransferase, partial [Thermoleophilia bacterium]|nr:CatB-related O-acetyltransferase [Thermoleophilia bacterium]